MIGVYFLWIRLCHWVDQDAEELEPEVKPETWNPLLFLGGIVGS